MKQDHVGQRQAQWAKELPDVDTKGMAILGRARWITLRVRPEIERVFASHGLDTGEFDVLTTLLRAGPPYQLRPTELFKSLMISSGGLTARLSRLETAGLIARSQSGADGRSLLVKLTDAGRECAAAAFREDMKVEAAILESLSSRECEQLGKMLAKLARAIDQDG